jgi:hypothetical protein
LLLERGEAVAINQALSYGDATSGSLNDDQFEVRYQFEGTAGDVVSIDMTASSNSELDSLLILFGPNDSELILNDDRTSNTRDARIENFTLPETGLYTIVATRYEQQAGDTAGNFTITLDVGGTAPTNTPVPSSASDTISNSRPSVIYTYDTAGDEVVTFELVATSGDLDPLLIVLDPDGREIVRNDDSGDGTPNSRLNNLVLEQPGEYTLVATRFLQEQGETTGDFELTVLPGVEGAIPTGTFSQPIVYGDRITGTLELPSEPGVYTFKGRAGERVSITLTATSGDLDPVLILTDAQGSEIAINDDITNSNLNSQITAIELPNDGYYTIICFPISSSGNYELWLTVD